MPEIFLTFFIAILPWFVGVFALYALFYQPRNWRPAHHLIAIGFGSYCGFLLLSLVMFQLQSRNLAVFSEWLYAWSIALILTCWVAGQLGRKLFNYGAQKKDVAYSLAQFKTEPMWLLSLLTSWLAANLIFVFWESGIRPATSWDSVWFWTDSVKGFLDWQATNPDEGGIRINPRHPSTVHFLNIWSAYIGTLAEEWPFGIKPWALIYAGVALAAIGFTWAITERLSWGLMMAILLTSSPVVTAQASLVGYADIWIGAGLFFTVAILPLAKTTWKAIFFVVWVTLITSLIFLKSAGISYTALIVLATLAAFVVSISQIRWAIVAILVLLSGLAYLVSNGFDLTIAGYPLIFDLESNRVRVGRYSGIIQFSQYDQAIKNLWFAFISSTSYLFASLVLISSMLMAIAKPAYWRNFTPAYSLFLGIGLLLYALVAQGFSEYFLTYSSPDKDTGLTRFSQGWFLVATLTLTLIINCHSLSKHSNQDPATE